MRRPSRGLLLFAVVTVVLGPLTVSHGRAQTEEAGGRAATIGSAADEAADEAIERARAALETARAAPGPRHPDASAWRSALTLAQEALAAARDGDGDLEPEALALVASVYQEVRWWSRALAAWTALEERVGELDAEAREAWRDASAQVGFARYGAGDPAGAERRFREILSHDPADAEALSWLGRIALEEGRPGEAADAFVRLVEARPDDAAARFLLELARERVVHGTAASDAHRRGIALYEGGDPGAALASFEQALALSPAWEEPARWRARTLLETGRSEEAVAAWRSLAESDPEDADAAWFLERARLEARVGREAALAADEALEADEAGDPEAARTAWERVVAAAPDWSEGHLGLGRAALDTGDVTTARGAFREVLDRTDSGDPERAAAEAGLERVALTERLGGEAASAYAEAVAAYERGEMEIAEERLRLVVDHAPGFVDAWSWLGRLAFSRNDWSEAAEAYERAAELEPGDDDFSYFAEEARRLAGPPDDSNSSEPAPSDSTPSESLPSDRPSPAPVPLDPEEEP